MKKCIDSRCQLNECTKICHTCNFTSYNVAYCEFLSSCKPWILFREFHGQCDLVSVDLFDHNFNFVTNVEYFLRVLYSAPGHFGDMKKSVCSTEIDECTEICNVLNNACNNITNVDSLHKFFLFFCFLSKKKLFTVTDDTASSWVEFCDNEFDLLICIFGKIFLISIGYKACRNKYSCFLNVYTKSTIQYLCYRCFQYFLRFKSSFKTFVAFLCSKTFVCQDNLALSIVHFQDFCFHSVTNFDCIGEYQGRIVGIFILCDDTICFITDVQDDLILFDIDNSTLYDLSISDCFYGILQHLFKT